MTTLYIDRKDIELRVSPGVLEFHEPTGRRGSVPLAQLERVVLRGRVRLTTSVLGALTEAGAGILSLSGRHSRHLATCVGRPHNDVVRRLGQFDAYRDAKARERWSRDLIAAKTRAQLRLLRRALARRPDKRRPLTRSLARLEESLSRVLDEAAPLNLPSLLGVEGATAAAYFAGYRVLFPPSARFTGRNRRPPRDPVNACLSLGYTLLHFDAVIACHAAGLDPLLGLYHEPAFGRESLAADVIEPLRPHVDEWVWKLFRDRVLAARDFRNDKGAVLLGKTGRQRYYDNYTPLGAVLRRVLRRQLTGAARAFADRGRTAPPGSEPECVTALGARLESALEASAEPEGRR